MLSDSLRRYRALYFETPADAGSGASADGGAAGDSAPAAAGAPAAEPAAASTPAADPPAAPWAESLSTRFTDETQRQAVDAYLREEIQPYITRREQELGGYNDLITGLQDEEKSLATYLAMTEQLYGAEAAEQVYRAILGNEAPNDDEPAKGDEPAGDDLEAWLEQQPQVVQDMIRERMGNQEDTAYETALAEVAQVDPSVAANDTAQSLFDKYVVAVDGDMEAALQLWQADRMPEFVGQFDGQPDVSNNPGSEGGAQEAQPEPAPAVLGQPHTTPGATAPPTIPNYNGDIDAALDDFMDDIRPAGASPAGVA